MSKTHSSRKRRKPPTAVPTSESRAEYCRQFSRKKYWERGGREEQLRRYHENKSHHAERRRLRVYGLSRQQYQKMLESQDHSCAICHKRLSQKLAVDHCHTTGKVRGLLCDLCNAGIGCFRDNPQLLNAAIYYLSNPIELPTPQKRLW